MKNTYLENSNIISPLGWDSPENFRSVQALRGGIKYCSDRSLSPVDLPLALLNWDEVIARFAALPGAEAGEELSRFEKIGILSVHNALEASGVDPAHPSTVFVLSSTKGNVDLLNDPEQKEKERLYLWNSAEQIASFFGNKNKPVVISNACISGVAAMLTASRLIAQGKYKYAIVLGADLVSKFIVSGFQSFMSLSDEACRPFDSERKGLTLGEAAATVILSSEHGRVELVSGATSNDANHISGPSRTGEGLVQAISKTLKGQQQPGLISAHGTATLYNDEMESIALSRTGLGEVPVNSLKGYFGHTLGAAGILESIINIEAMIQGSLPATLGFTTPGVSGGINVSARVHQAELNSMLKLASGFGGCNAAVLFKLRS